MKGALPPAVTWEGEGALPPPISHAHSALHNAANTLTVIGIILGSFFQHSWMSSRLNQEKKVNVAHFFLRLIKISLLAFFSLKLANTAPRLQPLL